MPSVPIYIRKENMTRWLAIESPSEWINTILANSDDTSSYGKTIETPVGPAVTVLSETLPEPVKKYDIRPMSELLDEPVTVLDYDERLYIPSNLGKPDPEAPLPYAVFYDAPTKEYSYLDDDGQKQLTDRETYTKLPKRRVG